MKNYKRRRARRIARIETISKKNSTKIPKPKWHKDLRNRRYVLSLGEDEYINLVRSSIPPIENKVSKEQAIKLDFYDASRYIALYGKGRKLSMIRVK